MAKTVIYITNLYNKSCALMLKDVLALKGYVVDDVCPGRIRLSDSNKKNIDELLHLLSVYGIEIIEDKELQLVEEIKHAVYELIYEMNNQNSVVRKTDYLVEKLGYSYQHIARVFTSHEPITLEKYIILQKTERIKQLIDQDE